MVFRVAVSLSIFLLTIFFIGSVALAEVRMQLGILLDGSASITLDEFRRVTNRTANALEEAGLLPVDGSVELTVVEFSNVGARTVIPPTVVTADNLFTLGERIRAFQRGGFGTPLWVGMDHIVDLMVGSPNFSSDAIQIINLITDGQPQIPNAGIFPAQGKPLAIRARDRAVSGGIDHINAEGIGIGFFSGEFQNFLLEFVWPQPGELFRRLERFDREFEPGFVALIQAFPDLEEFLKVKFQNLINNFDIGNDNSQNGSDQPGSDDDPGASGRPIPFDSPWTFSALLLCLCYLIFKQHSRDAQSVK